MADAHQWERWFKAFGSELQSVIPRGSISDTIKPELHGKVPGRRLRNGSWIGLTGLMADRHMTAEEMRQAAMDGAEIGILGRNFPAIDIDVDDSTVAADMAGLAMSMLGPAPMRRRGGSARRLLMYAGAHIRKNRLMFRTPLQTSSKPQAIEILGEGQYYNVEGVHPSGEAYVWPAGHPCDLGPFGLEELIEAGHFLNTAAHRLIEAHGCIIVGLGYDNRENNPRFDLNSPSFAAPTPDNVLTLLAEWHPEPPMEHDRFVLTMAAIKASLGPQREQFWREVLAWCPPPRDREPAASRKVWDSIRDSSVGWSYLLRVSNADIGPQLAFSTPVKGPAVTIGRGPDAAAVTAMMERHVWCEDQDKFIDTTTSELLNGKTFAARNVIVARMGTAGKKAAENIFFNDARCRRVRAITYRPGMDHLITQNIDGVEQPVFNIWRPSDLAPVRGVKPRPWLNHINMLFKEELERGHFLDWCAFLVQHPGVKINHAMMLYSARQGTGKDTALYPVIAAVGEHNVQNVSALGLLEPFTPYLTGQLVQVGEMESFEKRNVYNKLKDFLTVPPYLVTINLKHMRQYMIPKVQNWIATTNRINAVLLEESDRRFWMAECEDARVGDTAYFNELWGYYRNGGTAEVMGFLLDRNLSEFNPKADPPTTPAKQLMQEAARSPTMDWLNGQLGEGGPFGRRTVLLLRELSDRRFGAETPHKADMFMALRAHGWTWSRQQRHWLKGKAVRFWTRGEVSDIVTTWERETAKENYDWE